MNSTSVYRGKYDLDEIFEYIIRYKAGHDGMSPSIREIAAEFDGASTSVIDYLLDRLELQGRIERPSSGLSRHIRVPGGTWVYQPEEVAA